MWACPHIHFCCWLGIAVPSRGCHRKKPSHHVSGSRHRHQTPGTGTTTRMSTKHPRAPTGASCLLEGAHAQPAAGAGGGKQSQIASTVWYTASWTMGSKAAQSHPPSLPSMLPPLLPCTSSPPLAILPTCGCCFLCDLLSREPVLCVAFFLENLCRVWPLSSRS